MSINDLIREAEKKGFTPHEQKELMELHAYEINQGLDKYDLTRATADEAVRAWKTVQLGAEGAVRQYMNRVIDSWQRGDDKPVNDQ